VSCGFCVCFGVYIWYLLVLLLVMMGSLLLKIWILMVILCIRNSCKPVSAKTLSHLTIQMLRLEVNVSNFLTH